MRSITGPTAGTTCRQARRFRAVSRCQWGDYHAREAALYVKRLANGEPYLTFFGGDSRG